jgi:hypothetical protein
MYSLFYAVYHAGSLIVAQVIWEDQSARLASTIEQPALTPRSSASQVHRRVAQMSGNKNFRPN